jgi:hypothetical protein
MNNKKLTTNTYTGKHIQDITYTGKDKCKKLYCLFVTFY